MADTRSLHCRADPRDAKLASPASGAAPPTDVSTLAGDKPLISGPDPLARPERRLMAAVLEEGLLAARSTQRKVAEQARQWIFGGGRGGVFDFEAICDTLGLEADYIRRGVRAQIADGVRPGPRMPPDWTDRCRAAQARRASAGESA